MWFYVGNAWVEDGQAVVSVTDHSFLYGDACFEGIGISEGRVLHLEEHVSRLFASARALRIDPPANPGEVCDLLLEAGARNGMRDTPSGYLRPIISRGAGPLGVGWSDRLGPAQLTIIPQLSERNVGYGGKIALKSAALTRPRRGDPLTVDARVKSNNYLPSILSYLEARDRGADIGIMCDERGHVTEGHAMNIFCVTGERVLTPPRHAVLEGITREHIIATARRLGYDCREEEIAPYDLVSADEVFVTSSLDGVTALSSVEGTPLVAPGPVTRALRDAYVDSALASAVEIPVDQPALQHRHA
jgi:branched-chain amino acid aminotransferase